MSKKYEKANIDAVNNRGGFDSGFDAQVLQLDDAEKKRLQQQADAMQQPEQDAAAAPVFSVPGDKPVSESKLSFLEKVLYFFMNLFTGITVEQYILKRDLGKLGQRLKNIRPSLVHLRSGTVSGRFGEMLYNMSQSITGFRKFMEVCENNVVDEGGRVLRWDDFFISQFTEETIDPESRLTYKYITDHPLLFTEKRLRETVQKEVENALDAVTWERKKQINRYYVNLIGLKRLSEYNFYGSLQKFGLSSTGADSGYPSFSSAKGTQLLPDLRELENLLYSIDFSVNMLPLFDILLKFFERLPPQAKAQCEGWNHDSAKQMFEAAIEFLKENRLSLLVSYFGKQPMHKPVQRLRQVDLFSEVKRRKVNRLVPRCEALVHKMQVDDLNKRVEELFSTDALEELEFYNEQTNKRLAAMELPLFSNCRYLEVIKTFYHRLFEPFIRPALHPVVVDGEFRDRQLQNRLSDFYYKLPDLYQEVEEFQKKVSKETKEGEQLQSLINRFSGDAPSRKQVADKIHFMNHLSAKAIRNVADLVGNAVGAFDAIERDMEGRRGQPEFMSNIRQIGGRRNRAILASIKKAGRLVTLLRDVLKEFVKN